MSGIFDETNILNTDELVDISLDMKKTTIRFDVHDRENNFNCEWMFRTFMHIFSICENSFMENPKIRLQKYRGAFKKTLSELVITEDNMDSFKERLDKFKETAVHSKSRYIVIIEFEKETVRRFSDFIKPILDISMKIAQLVHPDGYGYNIEKRLILKEIQQMGIDDKTYDFVNREYGENINNVFKVYLDMYRDLTGNDTVYESDIVIYNKYMDYKNLYGALLSAVHAVDSPWKDFGITDFFVPSASGVTQKRYIYMNRKENDHDYWTDALNRMMFDDRYESKKAKSEEKHYYINMIVCPDDSVNDAYVIYRHVPQVNKYKVQENCVSVGYSNNMTSVIDGLNRQETEHVINTSNVYKYFIYSLNMKPGKEMTVRHRAANYTSGQLYFITVQNPVQMKQKASIYSLPEIDERYSVLVENEKYTIKREQ